MVALRQHAAFDRQRPAEREIRGRTAQPQDRGGDFLWLADAPDRAFAAIAWIAAGSLPDTTANP